MLHEAAKTLPPSTFPAKSERNKKGNKLLYSKNKSMKEKGVTLLNSPTDIHYINFVEEINAYYKVQEHVGRFNIDNTNITLQEHDPKIIITLLEHLLKSNNLNTNDPKTYSNSLKREYNFKSEVETFLKDMKEVELAMETHRIHKMGWS
jgi:hypothetical protein